MYKEISLVYCTYSEKSVTSANCLRLIIFSCQHSHVALLHNTTLAITTAIQSRPMTDGISLSINMNIFSYSSSIEYASIINVHVWCILKGQISHLISHATGVSGVLANSFVLKTFMKEGVLVSPKNILHINLAFSNILVVLGFPFSGLSSWHGKYDLEFFIFNLLYWALFYKSLISTFFFWM